MGQSGSGRAVSGPRAPESHVSSGYKTHLCRSRTDTLLSHTPPRLLVISNSPSSVHPNLGPAEAPSHRLWSGILPHEVTRPWRPPTGASHDSVSDKSKVIRNHSKNGLDGESNSFLKSLPTDQQQAARRDDGRETEDPFQNESNKHCPELNIKTLPERQTNKKPTPITKKENGIKRNSTFLKSLTILDRFPQLIWIIQDRPLGFDDNGSIQRIQLSLQWATKILHYDLLPELLSSHCH